MPYQVLMMGWVGSGEDFCGLGWVQKFWVGLGFEKVTHDQLCTTVTGPVGERLRANIEDAPVLDRPVPLRRLHHSGAGYKYSDLLTYLQWKISKKSHVSFRFVPILMTLNDSERR